MSSLVNSLSFLTLIHNSVYSKKLMVSKLNAMSCAHTSFNKTIFFNILLTEHLNIFISLYQPTWCTKFYNKFISSLYMFRAQVLIVRRAKIVLYSLWYHHTETSEWSKITKIIKIIKI